MGKNTPTQKDNKKRDDSYLCTNCGSVAAMKNKTCCGTQHDKKCANCNHEHKDDNACDCGC